MAVFDKPKKEPAESDVTRDLIHRLNDVDRRLRINEQTDSNQQLNLNSINENMMGFKKAVNNKLEKIDDALSGHVKRLQDMEKMVKSFSARVEKLPTAAEMSAIKTKKTIEENLSSQEGDLDIALSTIEKMRKEEEK